MSAPFISIVFSVSLKLVIAAARGPFAVHTYSNKHVKSNGF